MRTKCPFSLCGGFIAVLCLLCVVARPQEPDYKGFENWSWQQEGDTEYMLYTPSDRKSGQPCPLAIFLHGCCGEDEHATLRNAVDPPVRMWHHFGQNIQSEPTWIMAPKTTRGWSQKFPDIKAVIDHMVDEGLVDPQRIYMTGFSMGGAGTWQFMEAYPGLIAAAIPMGMSARADLEAVMNTPIWAIRGEEDWYARFLPGQVDTLRRLSGFTGGPQEWVTGVNPMYSNFEGVGHGVQWDAASTLPLTGWAYGKVNDGNLYPVVYFSAPQNGLLLEDTGAVEFMIVASDPDGRIREVTVRLDSSEETTLSGPPYSVSLDLGPGDHLVEALASDLRGKSSTATLQVSVDRDPSFLCTALPEGASGCYYEFSIPAEGNRPWTISLDEGSDLPEGLGMTDLGFLTGMPVTNGRYPLRFILEDRDGDRIARDFTLEIRAKPENVVLVRHAAYPHDSLRALVSVFREGALPNLNAGTEINISSTSQYEGMTCIFTDQKAADLDTGTLLSFEVDREVWVYVAYETRDRLFTSGIPSWLKAYEKVDAPQIVAQYRYFEVYKKAFDAGKISLPGADAGNHQVKCNYFVLIDKR